MEKTVTIPLKEYEDLNYRIRNYKETLEKDFVLFKSSSCCSVVYGKTRDELISDMQNDMDKLKGEISKLNKDLKRLKNRNIIERIFNYDIS